jgi:hypothetical protein
LRSQIANLMRKDFRVLRSEKGMSLTFFAGLALSALITATFTVYGLFIAFYFVSMYVQFAFSFDEKYNTERFFASLAVKRRSMVIARYLDGLVAAAAYLALSCLVNAGELLLRNPAVGPMPFGYVSLFLAVVALFSAISFPLYFKLGIVRARVITLFFLALPMVVGGGLVGMSSLTGYARSLANALSTRSGFFSLPLPLCLLIAAGALTLWAASIPLAVHFYESRDLWANEQRSISAASTMSHLGLVPQPEPSICPGRSGRVRRRMTLSSPGPM